LAHPRSILDDPGEVDKEDRSGGAVDLRSAAEQSRTALQLVEKTHFHVVHVESGLPDNSRPHHACEKSNAVYAAPALPAPAPRCWFYLVLWPLEGLELLEQRGDVDGSQDLVRENITRDHVLHLCGVNPIFINVLDR
jgi:hypothetical protein